MKSAATDHAGGLVLESTGDDTMQRDVEALKETALRLLSKLAEAHGAPGSENQVRRIFREEVRGEIQTDGTGSIIHVKKGSSDAPRIMLTAHMDEVGFAVQAVTKRGMLKLTSLGGWWNHTLPGSRVRILTGNGTEIVGAIGAKPVHFLTEAERDKVMKLDDMFVDVGASDADEVRDRFGIRLGDPVVPDSPFTRMHNPDYLLCKAFDNRAGMALTIQVLQMLEGMEHPNTVVGVGTVQEELGMRGAETAVHIAKPDAAIVFEGAPADDLPGSIEEEWQGAVGRGVQIRIMDPSAIMNRKLTRYAIETAEKHEIPHQASVRKAGATDARPIQRYGSGVPTIVLGVPSRYVHTHNGIIHLGDYLSVLELALRLLSGLDRATVEGFITFED